MKTLLYMTKVAETFCIVPWIGAVVAPDKENLICCRANDTPTEYTLDSVNTKTHKHLRDVLGKGIKDPICRRCWSDEAANIRSYRQNYNTAYKDLIASDSYSPAKLRFLELTPSNVCNLACRMCSSRYSSKIVAREKHLSSLNLMEEREKPHFTNWRDLDLTHLEELKLMGGEPMYLKEHIEILEYLDSINVLENLNLMVITNCTHSINDKWRYFLTKAKRVHIAISIDAIGKVNEYIRQYSSWSEVEKNLQDIQNFSLEYSNKIFISVNCTVGIYNVNKTKELEDYMNQRGIHYYFNPLKYPDHQSLHCLSAEHKQYFLNQQNVSNKLHHVLKEEESNVVSIEKVAEETTAVDEFYKKYLQDYNEEVYNLIYIKKL